jgi:DNA-binding GntR family transcriptional regulator
MPRKSFPLLGPRKTLTELVHQQLRADILRGRFDPGEFISTGKIAEAMGISSMPVRAALTRLETEGLIVIVPQRGVKVSGVSTAVELRELFMIRSRLEGLAAHLACSRLTETDFRTLKRFQVEMAKHAKRNDAKSWLTSNEQWHHLIIRASGNDQLTRLLLDMWCRGMSRRIAAPNVPGHMDRRFVEHEAILAALEGGDAELAERLWRDHILAGGEEIIKYLEAEQAPVKAERRGGGGGDGLHNARRGRAPATDGPGLRGEGG